MNMKTHLLCNYNNESQLYYIACRNKPIKTSNILQYDEFYEFTTCERCKRSSAFRLDILFDGELFYHYYITNKIMTIKN